jgi:hypothetical protein
MTDLTPDQARLYAATIAGLIAIIRSEIEDPQTADAVGRGLGAGALQLHVAIVITADRTAITAGIADTRDGTAPAPIFTHEVPTTWPAELAGVGQPRH